MSKASQIIILCEDKAHEVFVKRFLKRWGVKPRAIRVPPYPNGKGSGKKYVEDQISLEAEAQRRRHASTILLVFDLWLSDGVLWGQKRRSKVLCGSE